MKQACNNPGIIKGSGGQSYEDNRHLMVCCATRNVYIGLLCHKKPLSIQVCCATMCNTK